MEASYMKNIEILANFERELNLIDNTFDKPASEDSLYWLNQAVAKFTKLRYNGDFVHKTSYEQNDKRRMDLINLFKETELALTEPVEQNESYVEYTCTYPKDFMYALNEDVVISTPIGNNARNVSVFECTADSFMYRIMNGLTDFHYKYGYARPIRIRTIDGCKILTDGNYIVQKYTLGYLRYPNEIKLGDDYNEEYKDFPKHIMFEIIKIAAQMYIENQSNQRYQTITNEVNTQE